MPNLASKLVEHSHAI